MTTMDICIDCEGPGIYPNGTPCKSCGGSGLVAKGEGIAVPALSPPEPTEGAREAKQAFESVRECVRDLWRAKKLDRTDHYTLISLLDGCERTALRAMPLQERTNKGE